MKRTLEEDSDDKGCSTPERVKGVTATTPKTADFNDFANTMLSPLQLQSPIIGSSGVNESRRLGSVWSPTIHNDTSGVSNEVFQFPVPKALASKRSINDNGFDTSNLHNYNDIDTDNRNAAFNFDHDDNSRRRGDSSSSSSPSSSSSAMKEALLERARGLKTSPKNARLNNHDILYERAGSSSSTSNRIHGSNTAGDSSGFASLTMAAEALGYNNSNKRRNKDNDNNNYDNNSNQQEEDKTVDELSKVQSKLTTLKNINHSSHNSNNIHNNNSTNGSNKYGMLSPNPSSLDVHGSHSTMSPQQVMGQQQQPNGTRTGPKCNCKKSRCLKLYCDCFRVQEYCFNCNCLDCANTIATDQERRDAMASILERNKDAFKPRVHPTEGASSEHLTGCHCKRSACLKKYCECFTGMVACSKRCNCLECKNTPEFLERRMLELQQKGRKKSKSNSSSSAFMKNFLSSSQLIAPSVEQPHPELMNVNTNININMNMNMNMNSMSNMNVTSNTHLNNHNIHDIGVSIDHSHQHMGNGHGMNLNNNSNINAGSTFDNVNTSDMVKSFPDILPLSPTPSSPKLSLATKEGQPGFDITSNDLGSIARAVTELSSPNRLSQDDALVNVDAPVG